MQVSNAYKIRGMLQTELKLLAWREKAKERRIKIWALTKRLQEVIEGRENYKAKYKALKIENECLKKELRQSSKVSNASKTKVKHHSYSAEEISFFLNLRTIGGCSFRGCLRVLKVLNLILELNIGRPSPSTIRLWEIKMGYQKIQQQCKDVTSDWVLILDESVHVGSQKILLLIGVNLGNYIFSAPLIMQDVEVLGIWINSSWKAEEIKPVIDSVLKRNYKFRYCCCDNGNNLRKVLRMSKMIHIEDCGHCLGNLLEKKYKKDLKYQEFNAQKTRFIKQNLLSKYALFLPPKQRRKGRFLNLWPTCKWAMKVFQLAQSWQQKRVKSNDFEKIKWILDFEELIKNLHKEQALINGINKILKTEGLSEESKNKCEELIKESEVNPYIKGEIGDYLERNLNKLPQAQTVICSSDIIESIFGKLKNKLAENSSSGLTEGSLAMANYGQKITEQAAKNGMEEVKIVEINEWRKNNLPISLQRQKRDIFKNTG